MKTFRGGGVIKSNEGNGNGKIKEKPSITTTFCNVRPSICLQLKAIAYHLKPRPTNRHIRKPALIIN